MLLVSANTYSQTSKPSAINWIEGLNWNQIVAKAKAEKKYILIDCFATWCIPCKMMDNEVYSDDTVGQVVNDKFVSIKVQMDKTIGDTYNIRMWYDDAIILQNKYKVSSYPMYLFLSPDGDIVHKGLGYKTKQEFINLIHEAVNPSKQYYTLIKNYRNGNIDFPDMRQLALLAGKYGDNELATSVAREYKLNYLDKIKSGDLLTASHIEFISQFGNLVTSEDGFFRLFYTESQRVDSIAAELDLNYMDYSGNLVKHVISKEEIDAKLWREGRPISRRPDWAAIYQSISRKYNRKYANLLVPIAKEAFYKRINAWEIYADLVDQRIKRNPPKKQGFEWDSFGGDAWALNSIAWSVFLDCTNNAVLKKALRWSDMSILLEHQPGVIMQYYDTKANILYKLGRVDEAIATERRAIELDRQFAIEKGREKGGFFDEYTEVINKMMKGIPTWSNSSDKSNN